MNFEEFKRNSAWIGRLVCYAEQNIGQPIFGEQDLPFAVCDGRRASR